MRPIISVSNLGKSYLVGHQGPRERYVALRDVLARNAKAFLRSARDMLRGRQIVIGDEVEEFWALRDVSFEVQQGDVLGIIGRNGAGKSTLLKLLSRITEPSAGRIELNGRVASLLEVGTGFHPELTGRENVYLNGAILGMTREEIRRKFDAIVAFAEVENFLDTPVKRYSSGMYVRLAFSVAAHLEPEILVVDEVLAVGDVGFQRKCMDFMKGLATSGVTILLVSHNMFSIKALCTRAVLLERGHLVADSSPEEVVGQYEKAARLDADPWAVGVIGKKMEEWPMVISNVEILGEDAEPRAVFHHGERMRVRLHYSCREPVSRPNFCVGVKRSDNVGVTSFSASRDGLTPERITGEGTVELVTPPLRLVSDAYMTYVGAWDQEFKRLYCGQLGPTFHVRDEILNKEFGVFCDPGEWSIKGNGVSLRSRVEKAEMLKG